MEYACMRMLASQFGLRKASTRLGSLSALAPADARFKLHRLSPRKGRHGKSTIRGYGMPLRSVSYSLLQATSAISKVRSTMEKNTMRQSLLTTYLGTSQLTSPKSQTPYSPALFGTFFTRRVSQPTSKFNWRSSAERGPPSRNRTCGPPQGVRHDSVG